MFDWLSDESLGPFNVRVDLTFDRFGGKGAISRYQSTSVGLSFIKDVGPHVYWLGGVGLFNEADIVKLFASAPGLAWVPVRLGIRI